MHLQLCVDLQSQRKPRLNSYAQHFYFKLSSTFLVNNGSFVIFQYGRSLVSTPAKKFEREQHDRKGSESRRGYTTRQEDKAAPDKRGENRVNNTCRFNSTTSQHPITQ